MAKSLETKPVPPLTLEQLNEAAAAFVGDLMQMPPMVSAIKKKGVPLYKLARKGIEVVREPRLVHIYNFRFTNYSNRRWANFKSPARKALMSAASHMSWAKKSAAARILAALRRTASGKFDVAGRDAVERGFEIDAGGIGEKSDSVFETCRLNKSNG